MNFDLSSYNDYNYRFSDPEASPAADGADDAEGAHGAISG
jgi:hypothetical protein